MSKLKEDNLLYYGGYLGYDFDRWVLDFIQTTDFYPIGETARKCQRCKSNHFEITKFLAAVQDGNNIFIKLDNFNEKEFDEEIEIQSYRIYRCTVCGALGFEEDDSSF